MNDDISVTTIGQANSFSIRPDPEGENPKAPICIKYMNVLSLGKFLGDEHFA